MKNLLLKPFLSDFQSVRRIGMEDDAIKVTGVSIDSRTIKPGDLFIAIRGDHFDGHQFIESAINGGAKAVVCDEKGKDTLQNVTDNIILVDDTLQFLMEFGRQYRSLFNVPVIGLTGSTGKTTTKEMLAEVLNTTMKIVKTEKNQNNFIGVPLTLFKLDADTEVSLVELGTNHPGEIAKLTEVVKPTHAAITNIGSGHIGYFGSKEAIFQEKIKIFEGLNSGATIYLNSEDIYLRKYSRNSLKIKRFGFSENVEYQVKILGKDQLGRVEIQINDGPAIQLNIPGTHQVLNAALAATIGLDLGISPENVKKGLENFRSTNQRMEWFYHNKVLFINDAYNANPESLKAAIDYVCDLPANAEKQIFLILGDMLELGEHSEQEHQRIGEYLESKKINYVYCFGEESRIITEVLAESRLFNGEAKWFGRHEDIAKLLLKNLQAGDIVLIKGSRGMAMENVLKYLDIQGE